MDSSATVQLQNECMLIEKAELCCPLANFQPNLWGDQFLDYTPPDEVTQNQKKEEVKELKELVRNQLVAVINKDPKEKLEYVDAILRLGVAYHFENEIEDILQIFHNNLMNCDDDCYEDDLHYVSLRFRLLRLHGFYVSSDVFGKFNSENGNFKECLGDDVQGMLSLYEASYLSVHGETTLDEALAFATPCLTSFAAQNSSPMAEHVAHSLKLPLHKRSIRLESRYQISFYESKPSHDKTLLRLAKLDFNLLQVLHKMELKDFTRWWRSFDAIIKLPYVTRDRTVETYFWSLSAYHEPGYTYARLCFFKLFKIITVIDDMYDSYGSINDLIIFTNAIERWDKSCKDQLPKYMQRIYQAVLDTFEEFEQDLSKEDRSFAVYYTREQVKVGCRAYIQEAKWCHDKFVPTYDEYLEIGLRTANLAYLTCSSFLGMGKIATREAFEWLVHLNSKGPRASCICGRLMNDLAGHKGERERDHVASAVECYMKEYGTSEEETYKVIQCRIEETWKEINEVMLQPNTSIPIALITPILNQSRVLNDVYETGKDAFTVGKYLQLKVEALLVDPLII